MTPRAGDVLWISKRASVQFVEPIMFRVSHVRTDWITYDGWLWITGYQLDAKGDAVAVRDLYVMPAGLRLVTLKPPPKPAPTVRLVSPTNRISRLI